MPKDKIYLPVHVGAEGKDDLGYQKKKKSNFITNDSEEGDYSDLGALNNDDDEELLGVDYETLVGQQKEDIALMNKLKSSEDHILISA